jgi:hypothetical protein
MWWILPSTGRGRLLQAGGRLPFPTLSVALAVARALDGDHPRALAVSPVQLPSLVRASAQQGDCRDRHLIAPTRELRFVVGAFQPLVPAFVQLLPFEFDILGNLKTDVDCGRREGLKYQRAYASVHRASTDRLAPWTAVGGGFINDLNH